jgi:hypothetical protein
MGGKDIWKYVQGQSILGGEGFAEKLLDHIKGYRNMLEIPKRQRYLHRPD